MRRYLAICIHSPPPVLVNSQNKHLFYVHHFDNNAILKGAWMSMELSTLK